MREKIKTISIILPTINQNYNKNLLSTPLPSRLDYYHHAREKIIELSKKKIRIQDIGKKRELEKLLKEFEEEYERKKIEKENYEREVKESKEKMPPCSATMCFKRFTEL